MPNTTTSRRKPNHLVSSISIAHLQKIIGFSLDIHCAIDAHKRFTFVCAAAIKIWGYTPEELIGKRYIDFVLPADRPATLKAEAQAKKSGVIACFKNRYICKEGKPIPVLWSARWDAGDKMFYCVVRDGRETEHAEVVARQNEDLNNGQAMARIGNFIIDKVLMKPAFVSDNIYKIFGLSKDAPFTSSRFFSLLHPADKKKAEIELQLAEKTSFSSHEFRAIRADGKQIWISVIYNTVKNEAGEVIFVHGSIQDITEQKHRHEKLLTEKDEHRKVLTAAIINAQEQERVKIGRELHDHLSQVLATVKHYCEYMLQDGRLDVQLLKKMIGHVGYCVNEIRKVARELSPPEFGDTGLADQLREVIRQVADKNLLVSFRTYGMKGKVIPKEIQTAINRIAQEQLIGLCGSGKCHSIKIYLSASSTELVLHIKDDCVGIDIEKIKKRPQFINMLTRTEALKGTLQLRGLKGKGCDLRIKMPLG